MGFGKYGFSIFEQKTLCYDFFFGKKARSSSWFRFWTHLLLLSKEIKNCSKISNKTWIFNQNIILHWIHFSGLQTCYETFLNFFIHCDYHLLIVDRETAQNDFGEVFFWKTEAPLLLILKVSHVAFEAFANRFQFGSVLRSAKVVRDMQAGFFKEFFLQYRAVQKSQLLPPAFQTSINLTEEIPLHFDLLCRNP